ncbi:MAG: tetratricopeptide repeat protein [Deltaproteobacteria bacterium]|nr:tetratricopeptide repeat protein [Deltaproteobacteria bacterium]
MIRAFAVLVLAVACSCSPAVFTTASSAEVQQGKLDAKGPIQGDDGFKKAMAAYDYRRALDVATSWSRSEPQSAEAAIALATAANAVADLGKDDDETEEFVQRSLDALAPFRTKPGDAASAPAHSGAVSYLVAEALALRARTKGTGAIVIIPEVAEHGEAAVKLAPGYDDAAPLRLLGMVLSKAPPWPHGPGDPDRGMKLLQDAADRAPRRAEAFVHLADVMLDQSRVQDAQRALQRARELVGKNPRAKKLYLEVEQRMKTNKKVKQYD